MMTRMTAEMKRIFEQMNKDQKVRMFYELAKYISDNANENVEDNDIQNLFNDITDIVNNIEKIGKKKYCTTNDLLTAVEYLHNNTPEGIIRDADTILNDLIQENDFEFTGIAQDIFNIWKKAKDRKAVEEMFFEFVGIEFKEYLEKCLDEITRK